MKINFHAYAKILLAIALMSTFSFSSAQSDNTSERTRLGKELEELKSDFIKEVTTLKNKAEALRKDVPDSLDLNAKIAKFKMQVEMFQNSTNEKIQQLEQRLKAESRFETFEKDMELQENTLLKELNELTDELASLDESKDDLAEDNSEKTDTTEIRWGSTRIVIIDDKNKKSTDIYKDGEKMNFGDKEKDKDKSVDVKMFSLALGLNSFMYKYDLNLPAKYQDLDLFQSRSWNVNLTLIQAKINIIQHRVNLITGLGVDWNNYRFRNSVLFSSRTDTLRLTRDTLSYEKNKLMTQNLIGQLMLEVETRPDKKENTFHLAGGVFGGFLLNARTKLVTQEDKKIKTEDDFQLNNFRYGLCFLAGYGDFNLYVNYTLNDIFRKDLGPQVQNISFGIKFSGI